MAEKNTTQNIVAKLWGLCKHLQGGGVSYKDYVTELTYLLFLKMLAETGQEGLIPKDCRWESLRSRTGEGQLTHYRRMLLDLGDSQNRAVSSVMVKAIYADAKTSLTKPVDLAGLVNAIENLDWYSAKADGLGDLYEGLLEKTTSEKKSKAGQYFTPRPLIDCIVRLIKPKAGEVVQDPAAGTGGFLIAADRFIKDQTDDLFKLPTEQAYFQRHSAFVGAEFVRETYRLSLMNLILHGIEGPIVYEDSLEAAGFDLGKADIILVNPPFNKFPMRTNRADFSITADSRKGPLPFVEHVVRALKPGGRAAIVVPDNVLCDGNMAHRLRTWVMELCDLHTILRLPTGIFYAQGVKTNVIFFSRGKTDKANTKVIWVYDLRNQMGAFGKTRPLTVKDFAEFEEAFGDNPFGKAKRKDQGEEGRFRCFTREQIKARNDNLDITWLRDTEMEAEEHLTAPEDIAAAIIGHLEAALEEVEAVSEELEEQTEAAGEPEEAA